MTEAIKFNRNVHTSYEIHKHLVRGGEGKLIAKHHTQCTKFNLLEPARFLITE